MQFKSALVSLLAASASALPSTYKASDYTTFDRRSVSGSRRAQISIPVDASTGDVIDMVRLDLVGDAKARGFAQGALLTAEIENFMGPALDKYFVDEVISLDISKFPENLQKILAPLIKIGGAAAPKAFRAAMKWVWETELSFVPQYIIDEIDGMAEGICSAKKIGDCDVDYWKDRIAETNMLPELIRMACTALGAYGKATQSGDLLQLRALDFGTGPWSKHHVVAVHRGDPANPDNAFVSLAFPGFVGVITGVSQSGVGISEKVWMTYDTPDLKPGSYEGEPDIFVLRDLLQWSKTKEDAEAYVAAANRTWAMWIGVGDYASQSFDLIGYSQESAPAFGDETIGSMTNMPFFEDVTYVDKHPQPSNLGDLSLPTVIQQHYGSFTLDDMKDVVFQHGTGDVHWAAYDFGQRQMMLAIGKTDDKGNFVDQGKACYRPSIQFDLEDLWQGL